MMKDTSRQLEEISSDFIQIHKDIPSRSASATGISIAVGIGVMAVLGRFALIHDPKESFLAYLWMIFFIVPFLLTYTERIEAIGCGEGLYGLVRNRSGLALAFLVGWLELGGYAAIIVVLARVAGIYGISIYDAFGGQVKINIALLTIGVVLLLLLFEIAGIHGSRKLNTTLVFAGLILMLGLGVVSLFNYRQSVSELPEALRTVKPFKLSALLLSSFWGVVMMFGLQDRVIRRRKNTMAYLSWSVMIILIMLGGLLAIATAPSSASNDMVNVLSVNHLSALIFVGDPIFTILIGVFSIAIALIGISQGVKSSVRVMTSMTSDAYFPSLFSREVRKTAVAPLLAVALLTIFIAFFLETLVVIGMATAFLLVATILIHVPDIFRPEPNLPPDRPIHLPLHPLFPALTVVAATLALINLSSEVFQWAGAWALAGALLMGVYSYRNALKRRGMASTIADGAEKAAASDAVGRNAHEGPTVLVFVKEFGTLPVLIRFGSRIARGIGGSLVVMQMAEVPENLPEEERRKQGEALWRQLAERIRISEEDSDIPIEPMVRLTHSLNHGMISAAQEIQPQFLLVPPEFVARDPAQNLEEYDAILRHAPNTVIFLNEYPVSGDFKTITVLIGAGAHAPVTLLLAQSLIADDGVIEIVHSLPSNAADEDEARITAMIHDLVTKYDLDEDRVDIKILRDVTIQEIAQGVADETDLLILGASKNLMTRRATFGGVNAQLFQNALIPTMLVSVYEKMRFAWLSRLWETLIQPLPKLTLAEREEVVRDIIAGADPSVDFFILILLSSGIATYGLLQNSGAVIIGAMLVAPLMSPIIAIAMSMVRGDLKNLGTSLQATTQGVLVAISVGAVLTFFSPIKAPTNEIMGRVSPNLLDLGIAFLSGAAGGYAMSRKNIAAALPGVAIAAALVPPLTVVGYGFATADLNIAFGALLLFITNLIAIVLAASLVFLALDFLTPEKQTWRDVVNGLKITAIFMVVVVVILGLVTYQTVEQQRKLRAIDEVLRQSVYSKSFEPLKVEITGNRKGYRVKAMLLSYDTPLTSDELQRLGQELQKAVGAPVAAEVTMIAAQKGSIDFETTVTATQIEEAIRAAISDLPIELLTIRVEVAPAGFEVTMAVIEREPDSFSQERIDALEASLSEQFDARIAIHAYVIPVRVMKAE